MDAEKTVTACVLIIGNEILSGRTQDVNLNYLAKGLNEAGVRLREARIIPDIAEVIVETLNEVRAKYDYVFTTGGIGPTHDDITNECVAQAFGVPLILHAEAKRILEDRYRGRGMELNEARLRMAHVPQIMQAMFEGVRAELRGGRPVLSRAISCGLAEGQLAKGLGEIQARYPDIDIGSYPWYRRGAYGVSLVLRTPDERRLGFASEEVADLVRSLGGTPGDE